MIGGGQKSNNNKNLTYFPSINRGIEIHKTYWWTLELDRRREQRRKTLTKENWIKSCVSREFEVRGESLHFRVS